ncbi:MAG: PilZ domain-containing protein [Candidatus Eremiobacteraeota bacterium]|nr:PilZ domain-containing protein [Candidatus Eremiobacteraeota bacterium]
MLRLDRRSAQGSTGPGNQRQYYRQSIELPIAIEVAGLPAPVYGTLINISETGCRLRSLILIDRDRDVEFELKRPNHQAMLLKGRVVMRATPEKGGGCEYGVSFGRMTAIERAALSREIREIQRREATVRAEKRSAAAPKPAPKTAKQRRNAVRTMVEFPIRFRTANKLALNASANDISTGGLRLLTSEALEVGALVEMRFTLPNTFLHVFPPAAERVEITPFGPRNVRIPDNRRPFEEMTVHGRIVSTFQPTRGREVFGVQFTDVDGYQREEIARFTHSVQIAKLRTTD